MTTSTPARQYLVRVRWPKASSASRFEDPGHPRLENLRRLLPAAALEAHAPRLARVQALSTWLSQSWEHTDSFHAAQYAPWDAETILAWGARQVGHAGRRPVTMCVHYGVAFVSACQALGIPARCAIFAYCNFEGHFTAMVGRVSVVIDPTPTLSLCVLACRCR
jgi:transglutaminase-like putative cysteine protease